MIREWHHLPWCVLELCSSTVAASSVAVSADSSKIPAEITRNLPKCTESNVAWWTVWKWIRESSTVQEGLDRLAILERNYPGNKDYFNFLRAQQARWALCCFTWELTFGYVSSAHQESIHASLKAPLARNWMSLHLAPDFIFKTLNKRKLNRNRIVDGALSTVTIKQLVDAAKDAGCASLVASIQTCCRPLSLSLFVLFLFCRCWCVVCVVVFPRVAGSGSSWLLS